MDGVEADLFWMACEWSKDRLVRVGMIVRINWIMYLNLKDLNPARIMYVIGPPEMAPI